MLVFVWMVHIHWWEKCMVLFHQSAVVATASFFVTLIAVKKIPNALQMVLDKVLKVVKFMNQDHWIQEFSVHFMKKLVTVNTEQLLLHMEIDG